jgi:hypothetical protein
MAVFLFIFYGKIEMHVVQDQENEVFLVLVKLFKLEYRCLERVEYK